MNRLPIRTFLLGFCVFVGAGFLISFLSDPLGVSPVLDARENLAIAEQFAKGQMPETPFFRAILYPLFLSLPMALGLEAAFPFLASLLGLGFHFLNAWLVGRLAQKLWENRQAAWVAGVIYACYPVALFFSVQVLDITPGITLFLLCLDRLAGLGTGKGGKKDWFIAGLALGLAVLVRPNFLIVAPLVLGAPFLLSEKGMRVISFVLVGIGLTLPLSFQGTVNFMGSGDFRILPWQGSFNLYAANRGGADGRYFEQTILFEETKPGENTARRESEILYLRSEGPDAPLEPNAINEFWREKLIDEIGTNPGEWLGLMGRKIY